MAKNICLIGAGRIGALHAANIAIHPDANLHVVVDARPKAAESVAKVHGARSTTDVDRALDDPEVDGVLIASPTDTHVDLILQAIGAGKPVLCEKPIDLDLKRVNACLKEVERLGVPLQIGFNRRFDPSFMSLVNQLRMGEIGKLEILKVTSRDPTPPPMEYIRASGGLFRDMMIHDLDLCRWILPEEPTKVHANASCLIDPAIGEAGDVDTALLTLETASGILCCVENSRRAVYGYDQRVEVLGSKGMLQAGNPTATTVSRSDKSGVIADKPPHFFVDRYGDAYRAELEHFLAVIDGAQPEVTGRDGRAALVLADAALTSLCSGATVTVEL